MWRIGVETHLSTDFGWGVRSVDDTDFFVRCGAQTSAGFLFLLDDCELRGALGGWGAIARAVREGGSVRGLAAGWGENLMGLKPGSEAAGVDGGFVWEAAGATSRAAWS